MTEGYETIAEFTISAPEHDVEVRERTLDEILSLFEIIGHKIDPQYSTKLVYCIENDMEKTEILPLAQETDKTIAGYGLWMPGAEVFIRDSIIKDTDEDDRTIIYCTIQASPDQKTSEEFVNVIKGALGLLYHLPVNETRYDAAQTKDSKPEVPLQVVR